MRCCDAGKGYGSARQREWRRLLPIGLQHPSTATTHQHPSPITHHPPPRWWGVWWGVWWDVWRTPHHPKPAVAKAFPPFWWVVGTFLQKNVWSPTARIVEYRFVRFLPQSDLIFITHAAVVPLNWKRKDENHHFFVFLFGDSIALLYICSVTRVAPMGYKVLNQRIRQQCRHWQGKGRWLVLKQPEGKNVNASNALKRGWSRHTKVVLARKQITLLFYECSVLRSD